MEYNFLLLKDNKLSIQKNKIFLQLNQENLDTLKADYSMISTNEIKGHNPFDSKVIELINAIVKKSITPLIKLTIKKDAE